LPETTHVLEQLSPTFSAHGAAGHQGTIGLVWFGLLYIHSVTYVTLDTSITDYNLQHNL